jgi:O-antigen/teichoic acid export membrane protein
MTAPETNPAPGRLGRLIKRLAGDRDVPTSLTELRQSEMAKAAGLAVAMIANNVIALGSTVVFARLLSDYGSLAALVSYFLILSVVGQALQVATAREGVLGHLGVGAGLAATLRRWTVSLMILTVLAAVISVLVRAPIASAVGVSHDKWAAAIGLPAAVMWLELSILRGALQGVGDYKGVGLSLVGEQAIRLLTGALLAAAGLGVTGAYLGTPLSFVAMGLFCMHRLRRHIHEVEAAPLGAVTKAPAALSLSTHVKRAWAPIAGLIVIAVLQNIDIIAAKHRFSTSLASAYGATAVAAKVLIWVAMGAGFYLVPEVSRRRAEGEDTRPILFRSLAIIGVCAIPVLLIFAFVPHLLLKVAFGAKRAEASSSLIVLGAAFTVLSATYLAIQYMLALKRTRFLIVIGAVAVAEPILLLNSSRHATGFAAVVLAIQAAGAALAFLLALRREPPGRESPVGTGPDTLEREPAERLAPTA